MLPNPSGTIDVALQDDGEFRGIVQRVTGEPAAEAQFVVYDQQQLIAEGTTDRHGRFALPGVQGGLYKVAWKTADGESGAMACRLWAAGSGPPLANQTPIMASQPTTIRGQRPPAKPWCWIANPWVAAGLITAAIAIPIALSDDDTAS